MTGTTRTISKAAFIVGSIIFVLAPASLLPGVATYFPPVLLTSVALFVLIAGLALQAAYILLWVSRKLIGPTAIGGFVPDAWQSALISTAMVAFCWPWLAARVSTDTNGLRWAAVMTTFAVVLALHRTIEIRSAQRAVGVQPNPWQP